MIILGVDPGTLVTGYGVIELQNGGFNTIDFGVIRTTPSDEMPQRIKAIFDELDRLITSYQPKRFALETAFYGKNIQSTLKLGQVRGALMVLAALRDLEFNEYAPRLIKQSVTGKGNASKDQVGFMIKKILNLSDTGKWKDASDALAIAVCDSFRINPLMKNPIVNNPRVNNSNGKNIEAIFSLSKSKKPKMKSSNAWKHYALSNPEKVIR